MSENLPKGFPRKIGQVHIIMGVSEASESFLSSLWERVIQLHLKMIKDPLAKLESLRMILWE